MAKQVTHERAVEHKKQNGAELRWWSKEKINPELGTAKAEAWLSSKQLPTRPDRATRSTHEDCIEHGCPEDWES